MSDNMRSKKNFGEKACFGYVYGRQYTDIKRTLLLKKAEWAQKSATVNESCQDTLVRRAFLLDGKWPRPTKPISIS